MGLTGFTQLAPFPYDASIATSIGAGKVGTMVPDTDGNLYVLVDFQQATFAGEVVVFDSAYEASRPTSTSRGRVGVVQATQSTSDLKGWVKVYGKDTGCWGTSGVTSVGALFIPVTSDAGYVDTLTSTGVSNTVFGMWARSAASTATSPGAYTSTILGIVTVELNFPYVLGTSDTAVMTT